MSLSCVRETKITASLFLNFLNSLISSAACVPTALFLLGRHVCRPGFKVFNLLKPKPGRTTGFVSGLDSEAAGAGVPARALLRGTLRQSGSPFLEVTQTFSGHADV